MKHLPKETVILALENEIAQLAAPELERIDTIADEAGLREIFVLGNHINEQTQTQIYDIYFKYLRRHPHIIGDLHVWDRHDAPLNEYVSIDLDPPAEASYRMLV
jgi:hypothetical protein